MGNPLQVERHESSEATRVVLAGDITEEARFDQVGPLGQKAVMDLAGVRHINSCGVREWIQFIRSIPEGTALSFERCPPVVVAQANMISNFLGSGRIVSFVAPYYCPKCDRAVEVLLEVAKDFPTPPPSAPSRTCEQCGEPLTFDEVEESYLAFLNP